MAKNRKRIKRLPFYPTEKWEFIKSTKQLPIVKDYPGQDEIELQ
jgi:hypothetical protein